MFKLSEGYYPFNRHTLLYTDNEITTDIRGGLCVKDISEPNYTYVDWNTGELYNSGPLNEVAKAC